MKTHWNTLAVIAAALCFAGCASDQELTQKEKDQMARQQEREAQKQAQAQAKMMRDQSEGGQRRGSR